MFGLADSENNNKVNLVCLMLWYNWIHMTAIGKKQMKNCDQ